MIKIKLLFRLHNACFRYTVATFFCSLPLFDLRDKFSACISDFLKKEFELSTKVVFNVSQEEGHGDFTSPVALQVAKKLKKSPKDVAALLSEALWKIDGVESVDIAGSGYLNVVVSPQVLCDQLQFTEAALIPRKPHKDASPVIIEYSQPNIAKPLGVHHLLGTVIGQSVSNLYEFCGYSVIRWNYLGDWGTQFGKLAVAMRMWAGDRDIHTCTLDDLLKFYVKFHEESAKNPTLEEDARAAFLQLEKGDAKLRAFWKEVVMITKNTLADLYRRLHVRFDLDLGESFYEDKMLHLLEEGKKKGIFVQGNEGSCIVEFSEELKLPPYLVQKGDGATLYSTRDIAQMRYRIDTYHPQAILIFTDIAQKLHFEQLRETCKMLGWELPVFENVLFGRMRFADGSMSTRKGNILPLEEVLDEAKARAKELIDERGSKIQSDDPDDLAEMMGSGALAYGILSQNRKMDMVFDWSKMLSFEGNSAPYLQYTHARACSLLRKAEAKNMSHPNVVSLTPHERRLVRCLLQFSSVIDEARSEHLPHKLAVYLYTLCQIFNSFYHTDDVLLAPSDVRAARLFFIQLTANVLSVGASLLTIRVPDRM